MTPPEESKREWAGVGQAWTQFESVSPGDPIHAFVDFVVLLVIVASAIGMAASAIGLW